ncbi:cysteine hydrolase family protein [Oricola sp.]|uniref:cysteine hydrolase family protein n=1 Tax=Oricola sp. TaxID=1979950 RepID=UPI0025F5C969|nr:cysteine hydrolase family protein [Oricola sp.]MCI5074609.1 cysteine hydrolase [Oricola sp.]
MSNPKTLLELSGADLSPARLDEACLVVIDCQNEYLDGPLALPGGPAAVAQAKRVLDAARAAGAPVIHIVHRGQAGGPFDLDAARGAIIADLAPREGETVIRKTLPNAFAGTDLDAALKATGRGKLLIVGFMTHMCVSATTRAAIDAGFMSTIVAGACATRDLPDGTGGVITADEVHRVALAELADRFAIIVHDPDFYAG